MVRKPSWKLKNPPEWELENLPDPSPPDKSDDAFGPTCVMSINEGFFKHKTGEEWHILSKDQRDYWKSSMGGTYEAVRFIRDGGIDDNKTSEAYEKIFIYFESKVKEALARHHIVILKVWKTEGNRKVVPNDKGNQPRRILLENRKQHWSILLDFGALFCAHEHRTSVLATTDCNITRNELVATTSYIPDEVVRVYNNNTKAEITMRLLWGTYYSNRISGNLKEKFVHEGFGLVKGEMGHGLCEPDPAAMAELIYGPSTSSSHEAQAPRNALVKDNDAQ